MQCNSVVLFFVQMTVGMSVTNQNFMLTYIRLVINVPTRMKLSVHWWLVGTYERKTRTTKSMNKGIIGWHCSCVCMNAYPHPHDIALLIIAILS